MPVLTGRKEGRRQKRKMGEEGENRKNNRNTYIHIIHKSTYIHTTPL